MSHNNQDFLEILDHNISFQATCHYKAFFRFPLYLPDIKGLSKKKHQKLLVTSKIGKTFSVIARNLKISIMTQNLKKIVCTSSSLTDHLDA